MNKLQKLGVFVFTNYLYYNVIGMGKIASKHKKKKVLLYSAILSLMLSGNNSAIAEDLPILVSTGSELKSAIEKASNSAKIQFEKDIDISSLDRINVGAKKIEIDGNKNSLINEKDSRFTFVKNSSLALKNLKYVGKNASINVNNANTTILLKNVDISGRTTSAVPNGPVLSLIEGCDATLDKVSVSSSRVNIQNNSINGGAINIQTAKSKGTITDLIDNQITSAGNVSGGVIYNRRTLTPVGKLNLGGDVKENKITAKVNVFGGILNNESSSIQSINWNDVKDNKITATNNSVTGGFIQNKFGKIDELHINSFSGNEISSNLKIDGGLIYNESGTVNNTLKIGQIVGNTIKAQTDINGLITNVTGTMNSISIDSVSGNNFEMNFLRGGIINLQGASVNDITIGEINNNKIIGNENSTSTGFVLYLRESPKDSTISSNIGNLTVGQINENTITATNITSLLLRSALVPVENATVISKNGNVTVDKISNNTLTAVDCNDNARGGIIYNFLHGGIKTTNTTVSLGNINLKQVYNNRLESTISTSTSGETRALSGRHASGTIIANSIQSCQGNAIIKSINGEYVGNSLVSDSKIMDASGGVISNSVNGQGNAFVGIGYTLDENNKIVSVKDAILGTYKNNYVQSKELSANGGVIANYVESSKENDIAQIGNIKAYFEGNYVLSNNDSAYGGAIANFYVKSQNDYKNAIIDSINGTFENNCAKTESTDSSNGAYGGAISNTATIKAINNSVFNKNYAISVGGSNAYGGAISNTATIKAINNSTFKNNYAISNNGSNALGGAIYTTQDLVINTNDNKLTEFTGNYVSTDGGATKNYEAINVDASGKTLTLNATTGGTILLNDYINGVNGYNVLLTGDDKGTIKLYNNADFKGGANVKVDGNVVIDTADGIIQNFSEFNSLKSDASAKYNIDLDLSKANDGKLDYTIGDKIADGFTTQTSSSGTTSSGGIITIDNLNIIDNSFDDILEKNLKIQIIQNNDKTDSLQLALSDKLTSNAGKITQIVSTKNNPLTPTANYKDLFGDITTTKDIYGTLGLGKTNTTNDSLNIKVTKIDTNTVATIADALVALTTKELKDADGNILDKTFNLFDEDSLGNKTPANYKVSNSLGSIYKNLNIVGATKTDSLEERILSELDLDGKTSFVVNSGSTLNISDIKLKGNETVITNNNGNLNFTNNNIINGKVTGTTATNTGVLGINASNLDVALTNNGTLNLGAGNIEKEITGTGSTNILDAVTNNAVISQNVNVNGSGKLTVNANIRNLLNNGEVTSSTSNLTGTINNSGTLNLSGTLDKNISGNGTTKVNGTLNLSPSATIGGILDLNNGTISTSDSSYSKYNIASINGTGDATIDVDWANSKADSFNSTSENGVLNLKLNETSTENIWDTKTIQITNGGVGISLETKTGVKEKEVLGSDELQANTNWSDKVGSWKRTDTYSEKTSAIKSNGSLVNDTIQYEVTKTNEGTKIYTTDGDTLALIVQNTVTGSKDKTFTTTNANDIYTVKENLGILADNLTISGATDRTNTSTIILGDKQGITISGANSLTIKDVKITSDGSIINATSNDAKITLDNANLQGDVLNQGDLSIKNSTSVLKITGTGKTNIDTSGELSVSELIQNELTNDGNLTVNNLKISTSANNSGTITNNGLISEIKNLTNSGTINGVGNLEISGTSNNSGNISQSIIKVSGTLDNTLGTLTAADKIENIGSITTAADKIIATNGIINKNSLTLTNGTLASQVSGTGTTNIAGTVTNNSTISQNVNVDSTGKLTVNANIGNLTNNGEVISNTNNLTGTINNSGTLNLSGTLNKEISGLGTTKIVGDSFTMLDGAVVKGVLDINNQTLNVLATNTTNMFNDVNINSGTLNLINNGINNLSANSFKMNGNVNLLLDADLKNSVMDRLPSTTVVNGLINVKGINLLSDSTSEKTYIPFAYDSFKDKVQTNITTVGKDVNNEYQTTTFAPIYKYDVSYNPNNGNFLFSRGGGKSSADFNPAVLSGAVNSQVGAYSAVNETFNYAFRHADYSFMPLPKRIRTLANKYAITEPRSIRYENDYSKAGGIWYQPYANFENVGLSNGPRVDIQSYGSLIGGDSSYKQLKRGWGTVTTPYIGYNGTSQSYSGVSTTTNGGILGLTQTFYHGDFFTALTINAGASNGESSTMYGKENYTALMAGIGSKTGYNFEFNDGKFIIQPSMLMAYTYVNTFDYTNAAGVKISSDPLHSIQLHPSIKFMGNVGKGWQPYASVGMVWNILNETNFTANNVRLPEMSIRPYVEYGVGLQKIWHDKCTGFVQAMLRNGGRNGIALTFGFKWAVGKDNKPIERVQNNTKHVLKVPAEPTQSLEKSPQSIAVQSPIIPIQKVNNLPKNVIQTSNNTASLNSRLNILTPQQLAQRANFNITTSTPKTIKTSQLLKY